MAAAANLPGGEEREAREEKKTARRFGDIQDDIVEGPRVARDFDAVKAGKAVIK